MLPLAVPWAANGLPAIRRPLGPAEADWLLYTQTEISRAPRRVAQHAQRAVWALAQLGYCTFSGRAWRLWVARHSQGKRPGQLAPSHGLGCSSQPPPKPPNSPPLAIQVAGAFGSSAVVGLDKPRISPDALRLGTAAAPIIEL